MLSSPLIDLIETIMREFGAYKRSGSSMENISKKITAKPPGIPKNIVRIVFRGNCASSIKLKLKIR